MAVDVRQGAAARDDSGQVGALYERYSTRILAYCVHALGDRVEAEDAVQTTFLQAQRALQRGVTPHHEFAWLHTIAKNVCRTQKRAAARRAAVTGMDLDTLPARRGDGDESDVLLGLDDALASLPARQRRALLLREWHGLSSEEVASRLGMSAPATYALLTRARRSLASALSTVPGRSALALNVGPLLLRLKAVLAGGAAKVAVGTTVVAAAVGGGAALERSLGATSSAPGDEPRGGSIETGTALVSPRASFSSQSFVQAGTRRRAGANAPGTRAVAPSSAPSGRSAGVDVPTSPAPPPAVVAPEASRETPALEPTSTVETASETLRDALPEVPLPETEVDADVGVLTDLVPDEPVPPVDAETVTDAVPAPLPDLPPPELPPLP